MYTEITIQPAAIVSESFQGSLDQALLPKHRAIVSTEDVNKSLDCMLAMALSEARFDTYDDCAKAISEGLMLNINTLASDSLLIPPGDYVVWTVNNGSAMLVPVNNVQTEMEIYEAPDQYEVHISKLVNCWDKLSKVIDEAEMPLQFKKQNENNKHDNKYSNISKHAEKRHASVFQSEHPGRIHPIKSPVASAIESSGKSQEDIADELGVHPSTVSRWTTDSEKAGRSPTLDHAGAFAATVSADPDAMFRELSTPASSTSRGHRRKKTGGSGGGRNKAYRKGDNG